jgi:hypothetical protein
LSPRFSARGRLFSAVMLLTLRRDLVHITETVSFPNVIAIGGWPILHSSKRQGGPSFALFAKGGTSQIRTP